MALEESESPSFLTFSLLVVKTLVGFCLLVVLAPAQELDGLTVFSRRLQRRHWRARNGKKPDKARLNRVVQLAFILLFSALGFGEGVS